jgi:acetolactate synthase-1/2/3 large subunit/5-guanidino-2-oxopentanoate decarboxylase
MAALPLASGEEVQAVCDMLLMARKPLIVVGGGAVAATGVVDRVARATGAALLCTYAGRGIVADDNPLFFGSSLARPGSAEVAAAADLVLAVGTELSEVDLWRDTLGHQVPLIRVDIDPEVLAAEDKTKRMILSDAASFFDALEDALDGRAGENRATRWAAPDVAEARARWRAEIEMERPGILPVADALRAALPAETMIFSDMTQFAYAAKEVWPMDRPGHWHHPCGFGTLGYALPAAIGGKIGLGEQPVVAIAGDYGFQYTLQELMVAVELELSLPIILWDNGKLGEIEDSMVRAQIAPNAVIQRNPDFVKFAQAYGAAAAAPASLDEMQAAVREALVTRGPTLIYVRSDIAAGG